MEQRQAVTISQLNNFIKRIIESNGNLSNILIEGEISNFKAHSSGHLYFGLKDDKSFIKTVMFRSKASRLKFRPENGQKVIVKGSVSVYERDGQYQVYADSMEPAGLGDLYLAFEQMKEKLNAEGLFDQTHKKNLPKLPTRIGVVTSPTGAVWHDIQNVSTARFPDIQLLLYPAAVQGEFAVPEVVAGIEYFNKRDDIDVLIVGRGGGSLEDLWAFNTEPVARAIYNSVLPIISAVGHETDFTIADLVADRRAATPSQAAEMAVPALSEIKTRLSFLGNTITQKTKLSLTRSKTRIAKAKGSYIFAKPENLIRNQLQLTDNLSRRLNTSFEGKYKDILQGYHLLEEKLAVLSPLRTLERGYGIAEQDGKVLCSIDNVKTDNEFTVHLKDGALIGKVVGIKKGGLIHE